MSGYEGSYSSTGTIFITGSPDDVPEVGEVGEYDITRKCGDVDEGIKVRCFLRKEARFVGGKEVKPSADVLVAMCERIVESSSVKGSGQVTWKGRVRRTRLRKLNNQSGVELSGRSVPEVGNFEFVAVPSNVGGCVIKEVEVIHTMKSVKSPGERVAFAKYAEVQ